MTTTTTTGVSLDELLSREWLSVNHIGGFASSTACGLNTRKYHGLLVGSLSPPVRRMVLLSRIEETVHCDTGAQCLSNSEYPGTIHPIGFRLLRAFAPLPFPHFVYQGDGWTLEKQLRLLPGENTVLLTYKLLSARVPIRLELRPLFALRGIHELMYQSNLSLDAEERVGAAPQHRIRPTSRTPEVFFAHSGEFRAEPHWYLNHIYRREIERGYAGLEDLFAPGVVWVELYPGESAHFACSTEPVDLPTLIARAQREFPDAPDHALGATEDGTSEILTRAASQFMVRSAPGLMTRFPWAAPDGRDALIGLPGLLLVTHHFDHAHAVLSRFATMIRHGLIPSEFPEDGSQPLHLSADGSLWFINAVHQYLRYTGDTRAIRHELLEAVFSIIESYRSGTGLGIFTDIDGLLVSQSAGIGTSWMNAKLGDWVITPRPGRPVELNALWYNALRIAADLSRQTGNSAMAEEMSRRADNVKTAFNNRFWNSEIGCCFDVIHERGADPAIRPNQLFAMSLPYPVLAMDRFASVLKVVKDKLLTPMGIRTLSQDDPAYQPRYGGDVVARDRAAHQGTAYPWLLGAYVTALVRTRGAVDEARTEAMNCLLPCIQFMQQTGTGQLCELFDGDAPHSPGAALASASAVGEIMRCYVEDVLGVQPSKSPLGHEPLKLNPPVGI